MPENLTQEDVRRIVREEMERGKREEAEANHARIARYMENARKLDSMYFMSFLHSDRPQEDNGSAARSL